MFPRRSVAKFQGNPAPKFLNKSAPKCPSKSARMCQDKSAGMSPNSLATKYQNRTAKPFTSALCAHSQPMADKSQSSKLNQSTIREHVWNVLHLSRSSSPKAPPTSASPLTLGSSHVCGKQP